MFTGSFQRRTNTSFENTLEQEFSSFITALLKMKFNNSIVLKYYLCLNKESETGKLADNGDELYNVASGAA